jgi:hypothetical protein
MNRGRPWLVIAAIAAAGNAAAQDEAGRRTAASATTPTAAVEAAQSSWMVSETRSPVDYSPVAIASATTSDLQIAIQCRGGRSEMVLASPRLAVRSDSHAVSYRVNDGASLPIAVGSSMWGQGLALRGDVSRFLLALPERGEVTFRVAAREGQALEARFALPGLKAVHGRMAGPCKW